MHQSIQGKEVTFKDVLILFLKRFEKILAFALAFAIVFAALGAVKGYRSISGEQRQKQQDDYQIELDEYERSTQQLRENIEKNQQHLESMTNYTQKSLYYNLDAYNEAMSELIFYVDTGYQIMPSQYYQSPNKTGEVVSAYCDAYRSAGLYEGIRTILGTDTEIKYIDELLTIERAGDIQLKDSVGNVTVRHSDGNEGVIVIRARAQDEQTASQITDYVYQYLRTNIGSVIAEHTTTVLSDSTMMVLDEELETLQKDTREEIKQLEANIKTGEAELANKERQMPKQPSVSLRSVLKKAILYGVFGGILGGMLICLWVLLSYLADNRLDGAYQAAKLYNLEQFAVLESKNKKHKPIFHKLIDSLEGNAKRQIFADADKAVEYTAASVKLLMQKQEQLTVAVVSTRDDEGLMQICAKLAQKSDGKVTYQSCPEMLENADSIQKIIESDAVILVEQSGVSLISEINRSMIRLEKAGKEILGLMLMQ